MGWCSGTEVFDGVLASLLAKSKTEDVIRKLILTLEDMDWDCHSDSNYFTHPIVQKVLRELHPDWEWESEE